jgi:hypothetical protein
MTIDEQELSRRLEETAAHVSAPRFTATQLGRRIRRRRAGVAGAAAAVAVAAVAVAVPVALRGPGQTAISRPPSVAPSPGFSITVNGQAHAPRASYAITAGENLTIIVDVTVPAHKSLSALWIGITNGVLSPHRDGPADMSPILVHPGTPLDPGVHQFRLHWFTPGGMRAGDSRQLSVEWLWSESADVEESIITELNVPGTSGKNHFIPVAPASIPPRGLQAIRRVLAC